MNKDWVCQEKDQRIKQAGRGARMYDLTFFLVHN